MATTARPAPSRPPTTSGWRSTARRPSATPSSSTLSGEEIKPLYTAADLVGATADRRGPHRAARRRIRSRAACTRRCTAAGCGRCASSPGFGTAEETNERFRYLLDHGQTGLSHRVRHAVADGPRLRPRRCRWARSGARASRSTRSTTWRRCSPGIDLGEVTVSMTINAPAAIMLAFYVVAAEQQGVPADRLGGHDPGRHPQGVHRPEGVVLPDRPGDARCWAT